MLKRCLLACVVWLAVVAEAAGEATLFRLFLHDGTTLVSFGEFARLGDRLIFSMPIGGSPEDPRLYVVTLPASEIDWVRTDQYAATARSQWYAATKGEQEFQLLSAEVARVLNEVALLPDRRRGLEMAENARRVLADWPRTHFGYRAGDVREIVALLDESIADLRASLGMSAFDVSFVTMPAESAAAVSLLDAPEVREQITQAFRVAALTERSADRVGLLQAVLTLIGESVGRLPAVEARRLREDAERRIRRETATDAAYAALSKRFVAASTRAAATADITAIERAIDDLRTEDERLGRSRPETVEALRASLQAQLEAARSLRLRRDQWALRRGLYAEYQRSVGSQLRQLARLQSPLEAIRRLDGPTPDTLATLQRRLSGGAERLRRIGQGVPQDLKAAHDLLVSAWQFAERAVNTRSDAVASGNLTTAWEASSAAAGALLMLSRAQHDISELLAPPTLQ